MELLIPLETALTEMIEETPCGVAKTPSAMKHGVTTEATPSAATPTPSVTELIVTTAAIRLGVPRIPSAIRFAARNGAKFAVDLQRGQRETTEEFDLAVYIGGARQLRQFCSSRRAEFRCVRAPAIGQGLPAKPAADGEDWADDFGVWDWCYWTGLSD